MQPLIIKKTGISTGYGLSLCLTCMQEELAQAAIQLGAEGGSWVLFCLHRRMPIRLERCCCVNVRLVRIIDRFVCPVLYIRKFNGNKLKHDFEELVLVSSYYLFSLVSLVLYLTQDPLG